MLNALLFIFCMLSLLANAAQAWLYIRQKRQKPLTTDAHELLADLMRGGALIRVVRIAPEDVILRSPRR
jgi:hypothetical protein